MNSVLYDQTFISFSEKYILMRGLIVRKPFGTLIVEGKKKLEIRKRPTKLRERVVIIENGKAIGEVDIADVVGPVGLEELKKLEEYHLAGDFLEEYVGDGYAYVWVLKNPKKYEKPRKIKKPRGAMVFIKDVEFK